MQLIVHLGMGKTGTSALQSFLDNEGGFLRKHRAVYVGTRLQNVLKDTPIKNQGDVNKVHFLEKGLSLLEKQMSWQSDDVKTVLWSNESFSMGYNPREVASFLQGFVEKSDVFTSLKFFLVLRRQDEWIESAYKQWAMKHKTNLGRRIMTPEEFINNNSRLLDYNRMIDDWGYDGGCLDVASYDDVVQQGGVVNFFCSYLGVGYEKRFDKYKKVHESLGNSLSKLVSLYNRGREGEVFPGEFLSVIKDARVVELSEDRGCFVSFSTKKKLYDECYEKNWALSLKLVGGEGFFSSRPVKHVDDYVFESEVFVTYLSMICSNQQRRIENLNRRLHKLERGKVGFLEGKWEALHKMFKKFLRA